MSSPIGAISGSTVAVITGNDSSQEFQSECKVFMNEYSHKNSSQEEMKHYVECKNALYPKADNEPIYYDSFVLFSLLVIAILAFIVGYREKKNLNKQKKLLSGFLYSVTILIALLLLFLMKS